MLHKVVKMMVSARFQNQNSQNFAAKHLQLHQTMEGHNFYLLIIILYIYLIIINVIMARIFLPNVRIVTITIVLFDTHPPTINASSLIHFLPLAFSFHLLVFYYHLPIIFFTILTFASFILLLYAFTLKRKSFLFPFYLPLVFLPITFFSSQHEEGYISSPRYCIPTIRLHL